MTRFTIDRVDLPKPWANPLVFIATNESEIVEAEIEQSAAVEYQSAWRADGIALALAAQRTEYFIQLVEEALDRLPPKSAREGRVVLGWSDLNP